MFCSSTIRNSNHSMNNTNQSINKPTPQQGRPRRGVIQPEQSLSGGGAHQDLRMISCFLLLFMPQVFFRILPNHLHRNRHGCEEEIERDLCLSIPIHKRDITTSSQLTSNDCWGANLHNIRKALKRVRQRGSGISLPSPPPSHHLQTSSTNKNQGPLKIAENSTVWATQITSLCIWVSLVSNMGIGQTMNTLLLDVIGSLQLQAFYSLMVFFTIVI